MDFHLLNLEKVEDNEGDFRRTPSKSLILDKSYRGLIDYPALFIFLTGSGTLVAAIHEDALERMSVTQEFLNQPSLFYVCMRSE